MRNYKLKSFGLIALATITFCQCSTSNENQESASSSKFEFVATDTTWKTLSVREKIGQTMMMNALYFDHLNVGEGDMNKFMEKYPVGSFFIPSWYYWENVKKQNKNIENNAEAYQRETKALIAKAIKDYSSAAKYPILFSEDFERGIGETYPKYSHLPAEMALGAANDKDLAYGLGKSIAMEAKEMGFNWLLHPVCDLNMNPLQELVIERSVSDSVDLAIPLLKQQIKGLHDQNVISTVKHFPGDGVTMRNQHLVTTANYMSEKEWRASFGKLFQELINDGAATIMVGHIQLPFYQKEKVNGLLPPATLSKELMVDLLKGEMGFKGVIITDALNMGGCAGYYPNELEVSVQCFAAGADVVLWPSLAYMDTVEARINRGEIPMSRLDDAVRRVWAMRERFNFLQKSDSLFTPLSQEDKDYVFATGTKLAEKAVTLLEDRNNELPLTAEKGKKILLMPISYLDKGETFKFTKKELENRGFEVDMLVNPHFYQWGWRIDSLYTYDKVFICFENRYFNPLGTPFFKEHEAFGVWTANMLDINKRIVVSYSNPFLTDFYEEVAPLKVNAYSCDTFSQRAVVKALCGEIQQN